MANGPFQTPFDDAVVPTPSGSRDGGGTSGGFELGEGTEKESANSMSGLPAMNTTVDLGGDDAPGAQAPMPDVASPGTIHADKG